MIPFENETRHCLPWHEINGLSPPRSYTRYVSVPHTQGLVTGIKHLSEQSIINLIIVDPQMTLSAILVNPSPPPLSLPCSPNFQLSRSSWVTQKKRSLFVCFT